MEIKQTTNISLWRFSASLVVWIFLAELWSFLLSFFVVVQKNQQILISLNKTSYILILSPFSKPTNCQLEEISFYLSFFFSFFYKNRKCKITSYFNFCSDENHLWFWWSWNRKTSPTSFYVLGVWSFFVSTSSCRNFSPSQDQKLII